MPRQKDKHRNIEIVITPDAVTEALAMWVTQYHGINVDRKQIEIEKDDEGKLVARITKKPEPAKPAKLETSADSLPEDQEPDSSTGGESSSVRTD